MLFPRDVRINLGPGHNTLNGYEFGVVDDLTVRGGSSYDSVSLRYVNIWDRGDINLLSGGSSLYVADSYFGRSSFRASTGEDSSRIFRTDLGNRPILTTGSSDDRVSINSSSAEGRLTVNTGGGSDVLEMYGRGHCNGVCDVNGHEASSYQLNVIMGAQDDRTDIGFELVAGDRLNGGSGNGDVLRTRNVAGINAAGGPTINGYEFIEALIDS